MDYVSGFDQIVASNVTGRVGIPVVMLLFYFATG